MRQVTEAELKQFYPDFVPWQLGRVQIIRKKDHHIPEDALTVTRRTPFGNPFYMTDPKDPECHEIVVREFRKWIAKPEQAWRVTQFLNLVRHSEFHHLACNCKTSEICHADVWIEIWMKQGV